MTYILYIINRCGIHYDMSKIRFSTPKISMPYMAYLMYVVQCRIYDIRRTYNDVLECRVIHCDAHTHIHNGYIDH